MGTPRLNLGEPVYRELFIPLTDTDQSSPQIAEQVHGWMSRHLPDRPHPPVKRPINWMRWITSTIIVLGSSTAAVLAWPYVVPIITSRNVWAGLTMIAILVFTSGHMFNHIRHVPYVSGDGRGGISYFAGGFQNQFGLETQIVAAMCSYFPVAQRGSGYFAQACADFVPLQMVSFRLPPSRWP